MSDYVPGTEAILKSFGSNFASLVGLAPAAYGMVAGDAAQIEAAAEDYATKYDLAINPVTRTKAAIVSKDNAKRVLITILRGYAMLIKNNRAVTDEAKTNLGLTPRDSERTPVAAPQTHPVIRVVGMATRQHELHFTDTNTPEDRVKPVGVQGAQLFCHVGDAPPTAATVLAFKGLITKYATIVNFGPADVGKTAWYCACWQTKAGLAGPLSEMISKTIST